MSGRFYIDGLEDRFDEDCDLDALEDLFFSFNEYMAGGFGEDGFPGWWKPLFDELEAIVTDGCAIPAELVDRWAKGNKSEVEA